MKFWLLVLSFFVVTKPNFGEWRRWRTDRSKNLPCHIMNSSNDLLRLLGPIIDHKKINLKAIHPRRNLVKRMIVSIHNHYRTKVDPPASNMLKMVSLIIFIISSNAKKSITFHFFLEMGQKSGKGSSTLG